MGFYLKTAILLPRNVQVTQQRATVEAINRRRGSTTNKDSLTGKKIDWKPSRKAEKQRENQPTRWYVSFIKKKTGYESKNMENYVQRSGTRTAVRKKARKRFTWNSSKGSGSLMTLEIRP